MDQDDELAEWKAKVYQQIGRNVLHFQRMEQLLKIILPRAKVSISPDTDVALMKAKAGIAVEMETLGTLVKLFIAKVCDPEEPSSTDESETPGIKATLRLIFKSSEARDGLIKRLKDLVNERNHLVHHLLSQIDLRSPASWRSIQGALENQEKRALSEIEGLRQLVELIGWSRSLISHPDIRQEIAYGPIREQLLGKLRAASAKSADPEGWTPLKAAIHTEPRISPELLTEYLENFQLPNVSALLENVPDFELRHDKDQKGKTRTYYRYIGSQDSTVPDTVAQEA